MLLPQVDGFKLKIWAGKNGKYGTYETYETDRIHKSHKSHSSHTSHKSHTFHSPSYFKYARLLGDRQQDFIFARGLTQNINLRGVTPRCKIERS